MSRVLAAPPEPVWRIDEVPALRQAVGAAAPWIETAIATLRDGPPMPPSAQVFVARPAYRPPGSYRCFYVNPSWHEGTFPDDGVMAVKGMEPATHDFEVVLQGLQRPCYTPHNIAEHLVFEERKLPGSLALPEALREAKAAASLQAAHWHAYGHLARVPLPLAVFKHSSAVEQRLHLALEALLSKPALALAKQLLAEGLGIYVYYYPAPPVRVRDVDTLLAGLDFRQRLFALMAACEPEQAIRRWTSTFVRILQLGLLPGTLASLHTGVCCQPQNACIDGGFVDMDSLLPFAALADDAAVQAALQFSTESLLDSVGTLLVGGADSTRDTLAGRGDRNALEDYVLTLIEDGLMLEARSGLSLDPRARAYFARRPSFEALVARLAARRAPAGSLQAAATRAFGELGLELLRTARSSYAVGSSGASGSNP